MTSNSPAGEHAYTATPCVPPSAMSDASSVARTRSRSSRSACLAAWSSASTCSTRRAASLSTEWISVARAGPTANSLGSRLRKTERTRPRSGRTSARRRRRPRVLAAIGGRYYPADSCAEPAGVTTLTRGSPPRRRIRWRALGHDLEALREHEEGAREGRALRLRRGPRPSRSARAARGRSTAASRSAGCARSTPSASSSSRPRGPSRASPSRARSAPRRARSPRRRSVRPLGPWIRSTSTSPSHTLTSHSSGGSSARMPASVSAASARSVSSRLIIRSRSWRVWGPPRAHEARLPPSRNGTSASRSAAAERLSVASKASNGGSSAADIRPLLPG